MGTGPSCEVGEVKQVMTKRVRKWARKAEGRASVGTRKKLGKKRGALGFKGEWGKVF